MSSWCHPHVKAFYSCQNEDEKFERFTRMMGQDSTRLCRGTIKSAPLRHYRFLPLPPPSSTRNTLLPFSVSYPLTALEEHARRPILSRFCCRYRRSAELRHKRPVRELYHSSTRVFITLLDDPSLASKKPRIPALAVVSTSYTHHDAQSVLRRDFGRQWRCVCSHGLHPFQILISIFAML